MKNKYLGVYKLILCLTLFVSLTIRAQEREPECVRFQPVGAPLPEDRILRAAPMYPREALINNIEGWVDLQLRVNSEGKVVEVTVLNSEPPDIFNDEAASAARHWRFPQCEVADDYFVTPRMCWLVDND
jgi:TonB family protein